MYEAHMSISTVCALPISARQVDTNTMRILRMTTFSPVTGMGEARWSRVRGLRSQLVKVWSKEGSNIQIYIPNQTLVRVWCHGSW
jgi:hypothetical protein